MPQHHHDYHHHLETIAVDTLPPAHDDDGYESCSSYGSTNESLKSSIHTYIVENGRRYHAYFGADKSLTPTDEIEQDRLDIHHEIMLLLLEGELYKAPIENPKRILDVGTGTGIWAVEMAEKFPNAKVLGIDLSPIQPEWVPPNCRFIVDDAEESWPSRSNRYDFIHMRNLTHDIQAWPKLMSEMYRCTRRGGYVELAEMGGKLLSDDGTLPEDYPTKICWDRLTDAMLLTGRAPATDTLLQLRLEEAGFEDVTVFRIKQPIGLWPQDSRLKIIGKMALLNVQLGTEAYCMAAFTRILKLSMEEAKKICRDSVAGASDRAVHMYNFFYIAYGRKPMGKDGESEDEEYESVGEQSVEATESDADFDDYYDGEKSWDLDGDDSDEAESEQEELQGLEGYTSLRPRPA